MGYLLLPTTETPAEVAATLRATLTSQSVPGLSCRLLSVAVLG